VAVKQQHSVTNPCRSTPGHLLVQLFIFINAESWTQKIEIVAINTAS
jgi:hypothetical protein